MKIEIVNRFTPAGQEFYEWTLSDGPDEIEKVHGYGTDLITVFTKLIEWRERISADYTDFDTTDETDRVTTE